LTLSLTFFGFDFCRFGKLRLYGTLRVGKDRESWQELECYLFGEMLICVKEKKMMNGDANQFDDHGQKRKTTRCTLKGSILIKKHLREVEPVLGKYNFSDPEVIQVANMQMTRRAHSHPQFVGQRVALFLSSLPEQNPAGCLAPRSLGPAQLRSTVT
jgi:hypothetical protein